MRREVRGHTELFASFDGIDLHLAANRFEWNKKPLRCSAWDALSSSGRFVDNEPAELFRRRSYREPFGSWAGNGFELSASRGSASRAGT